MRLIPYSLFNEGLIQLEKIIAQRNLTALDISKKPPLHAFTLLLEMHDVIFGLPQMK